MGFMLLQYEFQRANREVNLCNRKTVRLNNQLTRATKRIEKMESVFAKAKSAIDTDWNNNKSNITQALSNLALGIASSSRGDGAIAAATFNNAMTGIYIAGVPLSSLVQINAINVSSAYVKGEDGSLTLDPTKASQIIQTAISAAVGQAQQIVNQLIESAKDLDEANLEQKHDAQLAPLSEKEGDLQAESSLNETLTTLWEQRRDSAKEKLPNAIENATGKFGLK